MTMAKGKLVEGGRIIVPAAFRRAMGIAKGDTVVMELRGDELRIRASRSALRRIQELVRPHAPRAGEPLASEQLVEERRREAGDA